MASPQQSDEEITSKSDEKVTFKSLVSSSIDLLRIRIINYMFFTKCPYNFLVGRSITRCFVYLFLCTDL